GQHHVLPAIAEERGVRAREGRPGRARPADAEPDPRAPAQHDLSLLLEGAGPRDALELRVRGPVEPDPQVLEGDPPAHPDARGHAPGARSRTGNGDLDLR